MSAMSAAQEEAYDVTVIGAGIVGLSTAYALSRAAPSLRVAVVEKEAGPGRHQTGRNSGVIHSGIYYRPGSLKARYALAGCAETPEFCAAHGVPYEVTGKLIVATEQAELPRLHALVQRGREHGIAVRELGPAQIAEHEPEVAGLAAIHVGSTGICDFGAVAGALADLAVEAGCAIRYGLRVTAIDRAADGTVTVSTRAAQTRTAAARTAAARTAAEWAAAHGRATKAVTRQEPATQEFTVQEPGAQEPATQEPTEQEPAAQRPTSQGPTSQVPTPERGAAKLRTKVLVNCAGLYSDRIARLAGDDPGMRIVPFRGEFYELAPARRGLVRGLVYPVPDPDFPFLGVHLTRDVHGGVHLGPNAVPALAREGYGRWTLRPRDLAGTAAFPGTWRIARRHWRQEAGEVLRSLSKRAFTANARRLLPALRPADLRPAPAGVRAQAVLPDGTLVDDFRFAGSPPFVHVLNAPSPAATAALPIGREVARRALAAL